MEDVLGEFMERFRIRGWKSPDIGGPVGVKDGEDVWQLFMVKEGIEADAWDATAKDVELNVKIECTDAEARECGVEGLAWQFACAVAGRAAHESLEWSSLNGQRVVNPHNREQMESVANEIAANLKRENPRCD